MTYLPSHNSCKNHGFEALIGYIPSMLAFDIIEPKRITHDGRKVWSGGRAGTYFIINEKS